MIAAVKMLKSAHRLIADFRAAKGGNVVITFALATIPVVGGVGAAVDYSRANSAKTALQAAIDSAALILSNWNPVRLMFFAWLFGFGYAIPLRLNDAPVLRLLPPQFIRMIPFIMVIVAIAGFVGKVRPPAAAGKAYEGGGTL